MTIPLEQITNMPAFCGYYPMPPARYRNVRFHYVYFRADVSAVDSVLPACFDPAEDGFCAAFGLEVPWSANYGQFEESGLIVKCTYNDRVGYFAPVVFLNSRSSIPAGREIYGTPKVSIRHFVPTQPKGFCRCGSRDGRASDVHPDANGRHIGVEHSLDHASRSDNR